MMPVRTAGKEWPGFSGPAWLPGSCSPTRYPVCGANLRFTNPGSVRSTDSDSSFATPGSEFMKPLVDQHRNWTPLESETSLRFVSCILPEMCPDRHRLGPHQTVFFKLNTQVLVRNQREVP